MERGQCITFLLVLGALFLAAPPVSGNGSGQARTGGCTQHPSVLDLVDFVAAQTGYPPIQVSPRIRATSVKELASIVRGDAAERGADPRAAYVPASKEILVGPDFDLCTALDRSYLVHELVHVHQYESRADRRAPCAGSLEGEAYRVQADYLKANGRAHDAFAFDLLGLLQSACAHFYHPGGE